MSLKRVLFVKNKTKKEPSLLLQTWLVKSKVIKT